MLRLKTYKYRLYPNKDQIVLLNKHFGACRWVFNYALAKKIEYYTLHKKTLSRYELDKELTQLKQQPETTWLSEVNSQSLCSSLVHLESSFTRFFREKKGFPKFKSKKDNKQSCQFPQATKVDFEHNRLCIMKFREGIKCKFSRTFEGKIKTTTISKTATDKYFVSILVEEDVPAIIQLPLQIDKAIGIDLGLKSFIVTSNGNKYDNPKYLKQSLTKLERSQRLLSRKKKGSNNRNKQRHKVALIYERITNQRNDFLHKITRQLVDDNQVTTYCLETLNIEGMLRNHKLAQSISDASWNTFVQYLTYKANWSGKNILRIGQFEPSSKACNRCGTINHNLTLKDRYWKCSCGKRIDRDINAACNIRDWAFDKQNLIGLGEP